MKLLPPLNTGIHPVILMGHLKGFAGSPAIALASQVLSTCHAHALMAYNAVYAQQNAQILGLSSLADHIIPTTTVNREGNGSLQLSEGLSTLNNTLQSIDKDLLMGKGNRYSGY